MLFHTRPAHPAHPDGRLCFAWWPRTVDRPRTGGRIFIWLEPYRRQVLDVAGSSEAARIITTRIRTGEKFEFTHPTYFMGEIM